MVHFSSNNDVKPVCFYQLDKGREPVREWLKALPAHGRKTLGRDIMTLQLGWPLGMPLARKMDTDLWEIRSRLALGNARILFTVSDGVIVLLHAFIKKSSKTSPTSRKTSTSCNMATKTRLIS